jgi:hypothetical protein
MDIDLPRVMRTMSLIGTALDELRAAVRVGEAGIVRLHTDDKSIELPVGLAAAGLAAFVALAVFGGRRRALLTAADTSAVVRDERLMEGSRARAVS